MTGCYHLSIIDDKAASEPGLEGLKELKDAS